MVRNRLSISSQIWIEVNNPLNIFLIRYHRPSPVHPDIVSFDNISYIQELVNFRITNHYSHILIVIVYLVGVSDIIFTLDISLSVLIYFNILIGV